MKKQIDIGDLVKVNLSHKSFLGVVVRTDRTPPARGYRERYWTLISGTKTIFPFMQHQLERMDQ